MVKAQSLSKEQTQSVSFKTGGRSWNGHYCCVPGCKNSSSDKKMQDSLGYISYHAFPDALSVKGKQWIRRIHHDPGVNFVVNASTKICSEHFLPNDFIHGDLPVQNRRRRLKTNAVPSIFPWKHVKKRQSLTSLKAMQPLQADCLEQSSCLVTDHECYESISMLNDSVEVESSCEFSNVEDSKELKKILAETRRKLAESEKKLLETEKKLMETERKLSVTQENLSATESKLAEAERKLKDSSSG